MDGFDNKVKYAEAEFEDFDDDDKADDTFGSSGK